MPLPSVAPTHELIIPASGTGITVLEFTGGVTLTATSGSVDVGTDAHGRYLTQSGSADGRALFQGPNVPVLHPSSYRTAMELDCEVLGTSTSGRGAYFGAPGTYIQERRNNGALQYSYDGVTPLGGRVGFLNDSAMRKKWVTSGPGESRLGLEDPYIGSGADLEMVYASTATDGYFGAPYFLQFSDLGNDFRTKVYAARVWLDYSVSSGMWLARQRQNLAGNSGGWPTRHRQNGGATGGWPVRHR